MTAVINHTTIVRFHTIVWLSEHSTLLITVYSEDSEHRVIFFDTLLTLLKQELFVFSVNFSDGLLFTILLFFDFFIQTLNLLLEFFSISLHCNRNPKIFSRNIPPITICSDYSTILECNSFCVDGILTRSFWISLPESNLTPGVTPATITEAFETAARRKLWVMIPPTLGIIVDTE